MVGVLADFSIDLLSELSEEDELYTEDDDTRSKSKGKFKPRKIIPDHLPAVQVILEPPASLTSGASLQIFSSLYRPRLGPCTRQVVLSP